MTISNSIGDITIYNLDGSLLPQRQLLNNYAHHSIDCYDIRGKNLYCEPSALKEIYTRYMSAHNSPITLIGSGNFHYVTYLHLSIIQQPLTLILFDHHTDLMENEHFITCGSWVTKALRELPNLKKAIIIGPDPNQYNRIPLDLQDRVTIFPDHWNSQKLFNNIYSETVTDQIYISIDKDVLDESFSKTNWDHGQLDLDVLLECSAQLLDTFAPLGIDICGEWLVSPENSFTPKNQVFIKRNEKANLAILQMLTKSGHPVHPAYPQVLKAANRQQ